MSFFSKMSDGAGLVSGMATRLDIDLTARLVESPEIETQKYANMVMRCARCGQHEACAKLQEDNPMLDEAPSYCRNRDSLQR